MFAKKANVFCWLRQRTDETGIFSLLKKRLSNIYNEGELVQEATVSKMEIVQTEGVREVTRSVDYYNLNATSISSPIG